MVKPKDEVIAEFNVLTNMSVDELQSWVEDPQSEKAGTGVGLESAHKIIGILKKNPTKDPEKYDDEDIEHMRKVVAYDKRHLAQENHLKDTKTREELENAKSTISLKNWGHDPLKPSDEDDNAAAEPTPDTDAASATDATPETNAAADADADADAGNPSRLPQTSADDEPGRDKRHGGKRKLDEKDANEDAEGDIADAVEQGEGGEEAEEEEESRARKKSKAATDADD